MFMGEPQKETLRAGTRTSDRTGIQQQDHQIDAVSLSGTSSLFRTSFQPLDRPLDGFSHSDTRPQNRQKIQLQGRRFGETIHSEAARIWFRFRRSRALIRWLSFSRQLRAWRRKNLKGIFCGSDIQHLFVAQPLRTSISVFRTGRKPIDLAAQNKTEPTVFRWTIKKNCSDRVKVKFHHWPSFIHLHDALRKPDSEVMRWTEPILKAQEF